MLEIEASEPPRIDLKSSQRYKMTNLCSTRGSFHLLGPKNMIKLPTQSAEEWICVRKWAVQHLANFIHQVVVIGFVPGFF